MKSQLPLVTPPRGLNTAAGCVRGASGQLLVSCWQATTGRRLGNTSWWEVQSRRLGRSPQWRYGVEDQHGGPIKEKDSLPPLDTK